MTASKQLPRGIRLNNPGNLEHSDQIFVGEVKPYQDKRFKGFANMPLGVRANGRVILTYANEHNLHTVRQIIMRWAPGNENDTPAYIRAVSQSMGVKPDAILDLHNPETMANLLKAIFHHENGADYVAEADLKAGVAMALQHA